SAKGHIWHVTRGARLISLGRDSPVVIHELAERFYRLSSGVLKYWRLPCQSRGRYGLPPCNCSGFDEIHLSQNPGYLGTQIGWENAMRVRVVNRCTLLLLLSCCERYAA